MSTEIILDNNLVLRSVRDEADRERYTAFNANCNNAFEGATGDCLLRHHPETTRDDYWLVEDWSTGEVVSTTCLLPWVCRFAGIDLRLAQLEMVLTHPAYRGRGLVRAQIAHFEQVVMERGFDLSIISGIPYYYRQFGYAYAIDNDLLRSDERITVMESGLSQAEDYLGLLQHLKSQVSQQVVVSGSTHTPLVRLAHSLGSQVVESYQWLLRFPDIARFLVRIGPVLESRLAEYALSLFG